MKMSMLMPVYNCPSHLLEKAIQSVIDQNYQDFEIVISDGDVQHSAASDKRVSNLLESLGPRKIYGLWPDTRDDAAGRSGFYPSLNRCMSLATGDIFSFLAGDDERGGPYVLDTVAEVFKNHGDSPLLVYGDCQQIDEEGNRGEYVCPGMGLPVSNPVTFDEMLERMSLLTPAVFWNRAVYEKFGLFDESLDWAADYEYWLRIWRDVDKIYVPKSLGHYRIWSTSQNAKNGDKAAAQGEEILRRYKNGSDSEARTRYRR